MKTSAIPEKGNTKARLRAEAIEIVAQTGLSGLSIRTLCQSVGIRESSFYAHFRSKDDLLAQLLADAGADEPLAIATRLHTRHLPAAAFVRQIAEELLALWSDVRSRKLRAVMESEAARSPELRARFNDGVLTMIGTVATTIERAVTAGELRAHASPMVMAWSLIAPLAALRATLLAYGSHEQHLLAGQDIARAHVEGWLQAYNIEGVR